MKIRIFVLLSALCFAFTAAGCGGTQDDGVKTHKAFTFSVDTGDEIRVELDTTGGYDLTSDLPFEITKDGVALSQGIFVEKEQFGSYTEAVNSDANAKVIESSTKDSNQYVFWSYDDSEFNIVVLIDDSNTGILLGNVVSEDSARECFDRLTISLDEE